MSVRILLPRCFAASRVLLAFEIQFGYGDMCLIVSTCFLYLHNIYILCLYIFYLINYAQF